ncbi:MAG: aminopeptidase P family protein [Firmicutes bacterium]|nr:aminopeptidase P family protein [Bacillota bacterium]
MINKFSDTEKNFFKANRKKLSDIMPAGSMAIVFSGEKRKKIGDEYYPFTPNRNFYYLTGIGEDGILLVTVKYADGNTEEKLFINRYDEKKAKWTGEVILEGEARENTLIEDINYKDKLEEELSSIIFNKRINTLFLDLENRDFVPTLESIFAKKMLLNYPYLEIKNLHFPLSAFRSIKTEYEKECLKKAIDITKEGIYSMMRNSKAGMYEYEIEAYFDFELKRRGVTDYAFKTIAASGVNATVLHYQENSCKTEEDSLILFDVGAQYKYYNADITRTFPVNGKFTERQRYIYDIVLEGQRRIIDSIKPGVEFASLNENLKKYYAKELTKAGLIHSEKEVEKYYFHGVSHMLGLETHDVGRHNEGELKEGFVLTVEPGLYIKEEGIGIRIEDDVFVTAAGCEVLSKDIVKEAKDIEDIMNEGI